MLGCRGHRPATASIGSTPATALVDRGDPAVIMVAKRVIQLAKRAGIDKARLGLPGCGVEFFCPRLGQLYPQHVSKRAHRAISARSGCALDHRPGWETSKV